MIELQPGSGFYYESESQYLIEFSESKYDWSCLNSRHTLVIPPFDHKRHHAILRHEKQHYKNYLFWIQNKLLFFIYLLLLNETVFGGFEEIYVCYRSQTLLLCLTDYPRNITYYLTPLTWLFLLLFTLLNSPLLFILIIIIIFSYYFVYIHKYVDWSVIK